MLRGSRCLRNGVVDKMKKFVSGNIVNPEASNPLPPAEYRHPAPASAAVPEVDRMLQKDENLGHIAYYDRSSRTYIEPQTMVLQMESNKGCVGWTVEKPEGEPDAPFQPVKKEQLSVHVVEEYEAWLKENGDWTKPGNAMPPTPPGVEMESSTVPLGEWAPDQVAQKE